MGSGVSKQEHDQVVSAKEREIVDLSTSLQTSRNEHKETEVRRRQSQSNLELLQTEHQSVLTSAEHLQHEIDESRAAIAQLAATKYVVSTVLDGMVPVDTDDGTGSAIPTLESLLGEEGEAQLHHLPDELHDALKRAHSRTSDTHTQLVLAQTRLAELQRTCAEHEKVILQQRKQILTVENRNERLKSEDPIKRLLTTRKRAAART